MKNKKCQLRAWCKKHGFILANGHRPDLPPRTVVTVLLGLDHNYSLLEQRHLHEAEYTGWRWNFSKFPSSDIYAYKVME